MSINLWANFLANEKLTPERVGDRLPDLIRLAEELAKDGSPKIRPHKAKLESRKRVARKAIDLSIDLTSIKHRGKMAMGRGMLDAWNSVYAERFGGIVGTSGEKELNRRRIVTKITRKGQTNGSAEG
jgi:hypothetical protein